MSHNQQSPPVGRVASLHLHVPEPGGSLRGVEEVELVAAKGIAGDERHFARLSRKTGQPTRRQVSLIAREQLAEHAAALGLEVIAPGAVRANIETLGVDLNELLGRQVAVGGALLSFFEARTPCRQMDAICPGLRVLMENGRQGVMAEVVRSGKIRVGDAVRPVEQPVEHLSG